MDKGPKKKKGGTERSEKKMIHLKAEAAKYFKITNVFKNNVTDASVLQNPVSMPNVS